MSGTWWALGGVGALALAGELRTPVPGEGSMDRTRQGVGLLVLAGAGALALYANRSKVRPAYREVRDTVREALPASPVPTPEPSAVLTEDRLPAGVTQQSGVMWSPSALAFVRRMRALLPSEVRLEVTSVTRTPERQAAAMLTKYEYAEARKPGGGAEEIRAIYGSKAGAFLAATPYTHERWAAVIRDLQARNLGFRTGHLIGTSVDFHTRTLPSAHIPLLVEAARQAGGKPMVETAPPHLHVDVPVSGDDRRIA